MKYSLVPLLLVGLIALASCAPLPAAPGSVAPAAATTPAISTTSAPAVTATTAPAVPTTVAELPASPTAEPTSVPAATTVPAGTSTAEPGTVAPSAPSDRAPTVAPGFTTHRDPEAGFAIDYPAGWFVTVPPAEARRNAFAYTASIRSVSPDSQQPRGQAFPAGETGIDVTVYRTKATSFDEAVRERRDEIRNSEVETKITSEEFLTLAGGLRAVRWQLETAQAGTVAEVTTLLGTNRIMVDGMGNLARFDDIARSLRPEGTPLTAGGAVVPAAPFEWSTYTDAALGVSLAVPAEWELCQNTGQSRLFCRKQAAAAGPAFPRFYVTVLPQGFTNADASAYNFISEEHVKALMALPVGSSRATNDLPACSTFTRLPDTTVNDLPAVTIENPKVWEGGANTKDRRVLVRVGTSTYMFGTYYETPAQLEEFERVLGGVRISAAGAATPQGTFGGACPSPTDDLQRLVAPVDGYCLTYPAEYKVEKPSPSGTLLVIGGLLNAGDPRGHITVTSSQGITLEEAARRVASENSGFDLKRSQTTVAGEPAVVFDGLPGQDVNRRVLFVHDGLLYDLYFAPSDPANAEVYGRLERLYKQVLGSFTFIPRSPAAVNECLSPSATTRLLSYAERGFCLLYPEGFTLTESADGTMALAAGSTGGANRSKVVIQVKDAGGKTAEQIADELVAGSSLERTFGVTIGYEVAQQLEAVPGPERSRHVLAVHDGKVYHLTFTPVDPSNDKAYAQMQALYDLVVRSFRFITPGSQASTSSRSAAE